jgi:ABC-type multidrug transport system fused ATPase/permease subunit
MGLTLVERISGENIIFNCNLFCPPTRRSRTKSSVCRAKKTDVAPTSVQAPAAAAKPAQAPAAAEASEDKGAVEKKKRTGNSGGAGSVSSGVRLECVKKSFRAENLLTNVSFEVQKGERCGLVGWNGAGKTTILKLITGELEVDDGEILRPAKQSMGYLTQEFEVVPSRTVKARILSIALV